MCREAHHDGAHSQSTGNPLSYLNDAPSAVFEVVVVRPTELTKKPSVGIR